MRAMALALALGCVACGGMSAQDKKDVEDDVNSHVTLELMCASDDSGASTCTPAMVRAMSHPGTCNLGSLLFRNGIDILDGGATGCHR